MKKTFAIFMLLVYTILTLGMTVIVHTCGGESETIIAPTFFEDPCGCADEMPTEKCCTTEVAAAKLDDAQKATVTTLAQKLVVLDLLSNETDFPERFQGSGFRFEPLIPFSPPPNKDLQIVNSVFLI